MELSQSLLFFFSALGAFNGLLLSIYFMFLSKPRHKANIFLGLLLLFLSIRIGKSVFFYFNTDLAYIYLQLGVSALLFVGPSMYFFLKTINTSEENHTDKSWQWHYGILLLIAIVGGIVYPFETNAQGWRYYVIDGIYYLWLAYMISAAPYLYPMMQNLRRKRYRSNSVEVWVLSIYYGCLLVWFAYRTAYYTSYIAGALTFSFVLYLGILLWAIRKKEGYTNFKKSGKYEGKSIDLKEASELLGKMEELLKSQELYTDPNLKISDLAATIRVPSHRVSQVLNEHLNKNFPTYINTFRIEKAKSLILQDDNHLSIEGIGYECGFNSKSTFYSTFKKITSHSPARYREEHNDVLT